MIWALAMAVFTGLTLAARWTELALALVITGVLWYAWFPSHLPGDNSAQAAAR